MGARETGGKATGAQVSQETGGKGDRLMGEREIDKICQVTRLQDRMLRKGSNGRAILR